MFPSISPNSNQNENGGNQPHNDIYDISDKTDPKVMLKRFKQYESSAHSESKLIFELKAKITQLENDLKLEREWKGRFMESFDLVQEYVRKSKNDLQMLSRIDKENMNNINKEFNSYKLASEQYRKDCLSAVTALQEHIKKIETESEEYRRQLLEHKSGIANIEKTIDKINQDYRKFKNEIIEFKKEIDTRSEFLSTIVSPTSSGPISTDQGDGETIIITPQELMNKLEKVEVQFREEKRKRLQLEEKHQNTLRQLKDDYTKFKENMTKNIEGNTTNLRKIIDGCINEFTVKTLGNQGSLDVIAKDIESKLSTFETQTKANLDSFDRKLKEEVTKRSETFKEQENLLAEYNTRLGKSEHTSSDKISELTVKLSEIRGKVETNFRDISESFKKSENKYLAILRTQTKEMNELKHLVDNTKNDLKDSENHVDSLNQSKYNKKEVDQRLNEIEEAVRLEQKISREIFEQKEKEFNDFKKKFDAQIADDNSELGKCRRSIEMLIRENINKYTEEDTKARSLISDDVDATKANLELQLTTKFDEEKQKRKARYDELKKDVEDLQKLLDEKAAVIEKNYLDQQKLLNDNVNKIAEIKSKIEQSDVHLIKFKSEIQETQSELEKNKNKLIDFEEKEIRERELFKNGLEEKVNKAMGTDTKNYYDVFNELTHFEDSVNLRLKNLDDLADKLRARKLKEMPSDDEDNGEQDPEHQNDDEDNQTKPNPDSKSGPNDRLAPLPNPPQPPPNQNTQQNNNAQPDTNSNDKKTKKK